MALGHQARTMPFHSPLLPTRNFTDRTWLWSAANAPQVLDRDITAHFLALLSPECTFLVVGATRQLLPTASNPPDHLDSGDRLKSNVNVP
jgi:hypothetical protein